MPQVVIATAYGGPEVLAIVDEPSPVPGPGEVRVEVRAAGVNPVDWKAYSGAFGADPSRLPLRLGTEAAGVVSAVGADAAGQAGPITVGDQVIAFRAPGAYAAQVIAPGSAVVPKPAALDWPQAGGLLLTGVTAYHLIAATGVREGDTVLIHGAAGGVGVIAVQLAVNAGAIVIGTSGSARHDFLADLGAMPVTYGPGLAGRVRDVAPQGVDAALDLIGSEEALDVSLELVGDRDRVATIAGFRRGLDEGIRVLGGAPGADPGAEIRDAARLELTRMAQEGRLRIFVTQTYPLTEVVRAHRASMTGHSSGKIVLIP